MKNPGCLLGLGPGRAPPIHSPPRVAWSAVPSPGRAGVLAYLKVPRSAWLLRAMPGRADSTLPFWSQKAGWCDVTQRLGKLENSGFNA